MSRIWLDVDLLVMFRLADFGRVVGIFKPWQASRVNVWTCFTVAFLQLVVRIPSGHLSGTPPPLQIRKRQTQLLNPDH